MKTKNIFRMLLVAAALLLGANNVKADTIILWNEDSPNGSITIASSKFNNYTQGTLYVYTNTNDQLYIGTGETENDGEPLFFTAYNTWIRNGEYYNSGNQRFEFDLTDEMVTKIKSNGHLHLQNYQSSITRVEFISDGSSSQGSVDVSLSFNPSSLSLKCGLTVDAPVITAKAGNTTVTGLSYTYTSSDSNIATVDNSTGAVTGVSVGNTTIIVSWAAITGYNAGSATYNVTVEEADVTQPDPTEPEQTTTEYVRAYIHETGKATFSSSSALNFSGVTGMKAYIATAISNDQVTLTQVSGAVAANTGLIIMNNNGNSGYFDIPKVSSGTSYNNNLLVAGNGSQLELSDSYTDYVLIEDTDGKAKFAEVWSDRPYIFEGYAYLHIPSSGAGARHRSLSIVFDNGTTGISYINNEPSENAIYNLRGQRVENPTKGLYIINGKKVVIK
jgi:uncharacterized protein YjdB